MLFQKNQTKYFEQLTMVTIVLYLISLFYNLHLEPLRLEEPRRGLVALEMLMNNNFIVTTLLNETWYDHPPLYNILLALSLKIFGFNTFALRFPCALSLLLTGVLIYRIGKIYVSKNFGIISALFYLVSVDIYFYFSTIAEIDIFYSLLVLLSLFSIFHFYQKKQFYRLFGFAYFFITLAFFTKGFASYAFIILTLLAYFIYQKNFKKLFSLAHIVSVIGALTLLGLYFYTYSLFADLPEYLSKMWGLTSSRTVLERGISKLLIHFITFPLNFIAVLFPATLFLLFIVDKTQIKKIKQQPLLAFLALTFLVNFIVYLISPGAKIRYTYMFFPMVIMILSYPFYLQIEDHTKKIKLFYNLIKSLMILISIVLIVGPFLPLNQNPIFLNYSSSIFGLVILSIVYLNLKTVGLIKSLSVVLFFVICRLAFNHIAIPIKATSPKNTQQRICADEIYKIIGDKKNVYVLSNDDVNSTDKANKFNDIPFKFYETAAYLEMYREKIITKTTNLNHQGFYIINLEKVENHKALYTFEINKTKLALIENL